MKTLAPMMRRSMAMFPRMEPPFGWVPEGFATLFNRILAGPPMMEMPERVLTTEETEKEFIIRAELPGFEPAEVRVELLGKRLMIEAEHRDPAEGTEERPERTRAHVRRVLTLPAEVEGERAEAVFRNGVLVIRVPRRPEAMPRRIEVKA
jgi:HSP20 family molecular chaperone IbpA